MPFALRKSGPDFTRDGKVITPYALISTCETCGYSGAPYGFVDRATGKKTAWCGRREDGTGYCRAAEQDLFRRVG